MNRVLRSLGWLMLVTVGLLVIWQAIVELVEPHLLLRLEAGSEPVQMASVDGTTLRLYSDTRPHVGKISGLQKGLIWVQEGRELVEEGYGFGYPILMIDGRAYLSRNARSEVLALSAGTRLIKYYDIDTVDTPIRFLRRKYRPVPSLGTVVVHYDVHPDGQIDVTVDFSGIHREWSLAYLMNEQGARGFTHYRDSAGTSLEANEIGIWQVAENTVERACFEAVARHLRFCIEPEEPATVYYGRERYNQRNWRGLYYLSWSGIDLEIPGPRTAYRYRISLEAT